MSGERRPRIMVLVDTLAPGGAERVAVELAGAINRKRFDPFVVVTKTGGPLEAELELAGVPYQILGRKHLASPRVFARALAHARRSELIHSHLFGNNVWGALLARLARVPLIAHEHNRVEPHGRLEWLFDRFLIGPTASRILCVSEPVARQLVAAGVARSRIEVVPNGVRLEQALDRPTARGRLGLDEDDAVVGIVAALRPEKRHELLVGAFASIVQAGRHPRIRLCIVGDGSRRTVLERLASQLGIADRVAFAGQRADAPLLHAAFDVSVLPSRSEGLPLAALEALAAGTPLVATSIGGLPELLADGAGLLVEPGDERALAAAIVDVIDDRDAAGRLSAEGLKRVSARHDLARTVATVEAAYRSALDSFRERRIRGHDTSVRAAESVG